MKTWVEPQHVEAPTALLDAVGGHRLIAETLVRRQITTPAQARAFLDPALYSPSPPDNLPGIPQAVDRIKRAVHNREIICVWGDFDVDGQTSTALLVSALRELGAQVTYHVPNRLREGHGISLETLKTEIDGGAQIILTCDTGIAAHQAVDYAQARGVDVVITDHHHLPPSLPTAHTIVNPKLLTSEHPLYELPGVGAAYKLVEALYDGRDTTHYLDLVALGIVADVAVQTGDTRYLLQRGLSVLRGADRIGLRAMMEVAALKSSELSEQHISFVLAPRLNALGRLADAAPSVEMLITDDLEQARILAAQLESYNSERKFLSEQVYGAAQSQIERDPSLLDYAVLVLSHPKWHTGVVGIVANRLAEQYNRPVILLATPDDGVARGSARSVDGCDITAAISAHSDILLQFGGHTMAAGLSLPVERIPEFRRALSRTVTRMIGKRDLTPTLQVDGYLPLSDLSLELVHDIERLAPFGPGNPPLTLATAGVTLQRYSTIGRTAEHLQLMIEDSTGTTQRVIWWQGADMPVPEGRFDIAYTLRASDYKGQREVTVEYIGSRLSEETIIDLDRKRRKVEVIDYRNSSDPYAILQELSQQHDNLVVWSEADSRVKESHRRALLPSQNLAVWTIPPGAAEWQEILQLVAPETIYLFGVDPALDTLDTFSKRLAGLLKYALNNKDGEITLSEVASACAHREETMFVGLRWLAAYGQINLSDDTNHHLKITSGSGTPSAELPQVTARLKALLQETAAYRAYWRQQNFTGNIPRI